MRKYPGLKIVLGALLMLSTLQAPAQAEWDRIDLLAQGEAAWRDFESSGWRLEDDGLVGETAVFDGAITDPEASLFLVSRESFGGDVLMRMHVTFEVGRYIGVYLNFGQQSQSGIWMATGHALPQEELRTGTSRGVRLHQDGGRRALGGTLIRRTDCRKRSACEPGVP
jgi:hypothetical protein